MLKRIEILLTGSSRRAIEAMEETEVKAREATDEITVKYESMGKRIGHVFEGIAAKGEEMGIAGSGGIGKFGSKLSEAETKSKSLTSSLVGLGKGMLLGVGAGALGVGYESVKIGMQLQTSQAGLKAALLASHEGWKRNASAIAEATQAGTNMGFTEMQVNQALTAGVISTQNLHKSISVLPLAMDLARVKGTDLATSMQVINKALIGNLRPLKQLGIDLNVPASSAHALWKAQQTLTDAQVKARDIQIQYGAEVNKGGKEWDSYQSALLAVKNAHVSLMQIEGAHSVILGALNKRLAGQAELYAQTLPGKIEIFKAKIDTVFGHVGEFLIPKLTDLAGFAQKAFDFVSKSPELLGAGAAIIGVPIIAALGSFANMHIIQPLMRLGRVFTSGEGPLQGLKNLFSGKTPQVTATDANTAALDRLTTALGDETAATEGDTGAVSTEVGAAGLGGAGLEATALGGASKLSRLGVLAGLLAGYEWHTRGQSATSSWWDKNVPGALQPVGDLFGMENSQGQPFGIGSPTVGPSISGMAGPHGSTWYATNAFSDPDKFISLITALDKRPSWVNSGNSAVIAKIVAEAVKGTQLVDAQGAPILRKGHGLFGSLPEAISQKQLNQIFPGITTLENRLAAVNKAGVGEIAKALEGKSKNPQIVKMLDEAGFGKDIGTTSGMLIGRALMSALKNQSHDWNLPYVIAQGFAHVAGGMAGDLNKHLLSSANQQAGANKGTAAAGTALQTSARELSGASGTTQQAADALLNAAQALESAAGRIPSSPAPRPRRHKR